MSPVTLQPVDPGSERTPRVVCLGECMVEFFRREDGFWSQGFAGDSFNVAWALRALLPPSAEVAYLTRVGTDALSEDMLSMFRAAGIETRHVARDPERSVGLYTIRTDARGERSFTYWRSESAARGLARDGAALAAAFDGADLVYLSGISLAILPPEDRDRLIGRLCQRGQRRFRVAFDPNIRPRLWPDLRSATAAITALAGIADILLPTHDDEALAFGDPDAAATLRRYARLGVPEIVVKDGIRPTLYQTGEVTGARPVAPVARALDTTGAGDSFNGAYLAARLTGAGQAAAVAAGQGVSAEVVMHRGALMPAAQLRAVATGA
ncbi:sugar kinase [Rhodobacter calidifons]|uniref:Sugar kinase n=1 Tax=Rhodobacter calidifons TaxID=2715277 RepID=A0ABX0G8Z3_9RHOB|nr:sugar kinase [Rhodobacter calidifons]NHB77747.1 sugar kinase [Rhodobacter calidifons]